MLVKCLISCPINQLYNLFSLEIITYPSKHPLFYFREKKYHKTGIKIWKHCLFVCLFQFQSIVIYLCFFFNINKNSHCHSIYLRPSGYRSSLSEICLKSEDFYLADTFWVQSLSWEIFFITFDPVPFIDNIL
jgi:hypothetical protein